MSKAQTALDQILDNEEIIPACAGEYSEKYVTMSSIGKGAFGFVKLATRRLDGEEVCLWLQYS